MKKLLVILFAACSLNMYAQSAAKDTSWKKNYRESSPIINNLVHTKVDAKFDFAKSYMYGKVWLTLKPHFYPTDSLRLDAKGMEIKKVAIIKNGKELPLKYEYDGWEMNIQLDKTYTRNEEYTVYIDYTAKPDEVKVKGSAAINDAKGLYFINPRGEEKDKPTQIWTQGETEATSVWCPIIDKPNQKTTDEISMTVPAKYVTLSNGKLVSQKKNADGTRTDTWKMDLPHAPYLFFMGVGEYSIIKDSYKGKEVSYYVEKEYAPVARKIFGLTPEMITFYSKITGVDYPWVKYSQIVGRDYVSGAMENTTATLHQESANQDARELTDGNDWEDVIAHELFHQWLGDYVTTESWSNLTLNESFANYSETLWNEYKYGKDAGDAHNYSDMQGYLMSGGDKKDLVRFYYNDKEDMFDGVSYNKGGRILHMLRNYVGDSAFFKALNNYLTTNKFKSAEAQNLRLAFEEVTGRDLNWYWNQWYYGAGHPKLDINYSYDASAKKVIVVVKQNQSGEKLFKLPVAIDVYNGAAKTRYNVWAQNRVDTFSFDAATQPDLVNFDGDKILLCTKTENKTIDNYIHQYKYAAKYLDRREAIDFALKNQDDPKAIALLKDALKDKYEGLRSYTISKLNLKKDGVKNATEEVLASLATNDPIRRVKAAAITKISELNNAKYAPLFTAALNDSSYTVAGNALTALGKIDSAAAFKAAQRLSKEPSKGVLSSAISNTLIKLGSEDDAEVVFGFFEKMPLSQAKFESLQTLANFITKAKKMENVKRGVDDIMGFKNDLPESIQGQVEGFITNMLKTVQKKKEDAGLKEQADYIKSILENKKGF